MLVAHRHPVMLVFCQLLLDRNKDYQPLQERKSNQLQYIEVLVTVISRLVCSKQSYSGGSPNHEFLVVVKLDLLFWSLKTSVHISARGCELFTVGMDPGR